MAFHPRQNSMLHFAFYFSHFILHLLFDIWVYTFFIQLSSCNIQVFALYIHLFVRNIQVHVQGQRVALPSVEHLPIKFLLSTFDFAYFTCKFALYIQLFKLYFSSAGHPPRVIGGLNWLSPPPLTSRSKNFLQEWGRETFSSTDSIRSTSCQQDKKTQGVIGHTDSLRVWKHL